MATKNATNRTQQTAADQNLLDGIKKHQQALSSFTIGGKSYTPADILAILQARIASGGTVLSTRATWQNAVASDKGGRTNTRAVVSGVRQAIGLMFAGAVDTLADFGLKPRKVPAVRTPEEKALANAKAKATRTARHTMGSQQKKAVKGTVTTIVSPTPPAAAPPVVPPAPSPVASGPAQGTPNAGATPRIP